MSPVLIIVLCIVAALLIAALILIRVYILKPIEDYPDFVKKESGDMESFDFVYQKPDDENLTKLRELYDLEKIAGEGSEIEKLIKLMRWTHQLTKHAPNPVYPEILNSLHLIDLIQNEGKQINCFMYAVILNEVYLAMGYPTRAIHLEPLNFEDKESHFVVSVYSREYDKWIMMDPDMCAYVMDEDGIPLGIMEIRARLISKQPMFINDEIVAFMKYFGKNFYLRYLKKNIFRFYCLKTSAFDQFSSKNKRILHLVPNGFWDEKINTVETTPRGSKMFYTHDAELFWQKPVGFV